MTTTMASRAVSGAAILLDSNVLIYSVDRAEPEKGRIARDLLHELTLLRRASCSTQTLGEFFQIATRRIPTPLSAEEASELVRTYNAIWRMQPITVHTMLEALRGHIRYGFPYWDAQLWATARLNDISLILSEDFSDGSEFEGVRFANPFAGGFDLEAVANQ